MSYFEILTWVVSFLRSDRGRLLMEMAKELIDWLVSHRPATVEECETCAAQFATTKGIAL